MNWHVTTAGVKKLVEQTKMQCLNNVCNTSFGALCRLKGLTYIFLPHNSLIQTWVSAFPMHTL